MVLTALALCLTPILSLSQEIPEGKIWRNNSPMSSFYASGQGETRDSTLVQQPDVAVQSKKWLTVTHSVHTSLHVLHVNRGEWALRGILNILNLPSSLSFIGWQWGKKLLFFLKAESQVSSTCNIISFDILCSCATSGNKNKDRKPKLTTL